MGSLLDVQPPPGLFPNTPAPTTSSRPATSAGLSTNAQNLIAKYGLQSRIEADIKGKGKETQPESLQSWATTASDREKILKERKARMVLEARRFVSICMSCFARLSSILCEQKDDGEGGAEAFVTIIHLPSNTLDQIGTATPLFAYYV